MFVMKRASQLMLIILAVFLLGSSSCERGKERYGETLNATWRQIFSLNPQDGDYRWYGYPVDNFGVLTAYDPPAGTPFRDSDRICATWSCLDIVPAAVPTDPMARLNVNGYADIGGGGGITLTQEQANKIGVNLLLPNLAQVANFKAGVDLSRGVKTKVTLGRAYKRSAVRDLYTEFIEKKSTKPTLKTAFTNGRLVWVAADIVAESFDVDITVDTKRNAELGAELTKAASAVAKDSSAKVAITSGAEGQYHISVKNPVVLAVQTRTQPAGGTLTAGQGGSVYSAPLPRPVYSLFE
jgi:hypothetical protein